MTLSKPPPSNPARPHPFSLRLSDAEKAYLFRAAGSQSVASYVRRQLFGEAASPIKPRRKLNQTTPDKAALAKALGQLGQSNLSASLSALARAAETGALEVTPDIAEALREACADFRMMRRDLTTALGLK